MRFFQRSIQSLAKKPIAAATGVLAVDFYYSLQIIRNQWAGQEFFHCTIHPAP
jgi:hypothetical protein